MNSLVNRCKTGEPTTIEITCCQPRQPEPLDCAPYAFDGNLGDEIAAAVAVTDRCAVLPAVASEDFESLFSCFIS